MNTQTTNATMRLSPDQIQLLLTAININNDGVRFLATKDTTNALRMFAQALSVIDQKLWQNIDVHDGAMILNTTSLSSMLLVPIPDLQDESFYVFDRALLLNPALCCPTETRPPPTTGLVYAMATLIAFNMGLSGHYSAKTAGATISLEATCQSYQLCLDFLNGGAKGCIVDIAARNNLAHIKSQIQGDRRGASQILHEVELTLADQEMHLPCNQDAEHLDEILLNKIVLDLSPHSTIGAAAA